MILEAVDSPKLFVTFTFNNPDMFTHPDKTSSPVFTPLGALSPVRATVFRLDEPSVITPSIGTLSPGFTITISPTETSFGDTALTAPLRSTFAISGLISIRCDMDLRLLPSA